ncbi:purine-nucleoside phosphorylase [Allostreptomyces psammosilenae]|uniref:Purine nucleoside permease n=1 Tax=Allostreptomyces psammosilenae TaxID=1892865 RepID=A0A852ZYL8_9ACTN|nr:purine nucleoside permease [Allostreptomyces psammosilenae]NYI07436.1 purine nucleoside permease [Allostreptomyces psammosilenae]
MPRIPRRTPRPSLAVAATTAAVLAATGIAPASGAAGGDGSPSNRRVKVGVLVITMFEGETAPWLANESLPLSVDVPGAYGPVRCDTEGLCVLTTGMGKSNAAATMSAVLDSPRLDFDDAYFLTAGIAGTPPENGTLGFAAWARWIVDYDLGHHLLPETAPDVPHGYLPLDMDTSVFRLNDDLVEEAYELTKDLELADSERSREIRSRYPGQEGVRPYVTVCDTVTGDDWFSGRELSERAGYITDLRTDGQGEYCTTQMEDNATATVLARRGHLDRYLNLRTASNFDQPYPGQSVTEHIATDSGAYRSSVDNAYLVGSTVADHLLAHPPVD